MTCDDKNTIFQGDDTSAFGQNFLKINATIPEGWQISKVELRIGNLPLFVFENPVFPLFVNLDSDQTRMLEKTNEVYMAVYDVNGKKITCKGSIIIKSKAEVV